MDLRQLEEEESTRLYPQLNNKVEIGQNPQQCSEKLPMTNTNRNHSYKEVNIFNN